MASRTKPGPTEKRRRRVRDFNKTRWLYQKDGRDLGPYRPPEIKDLLRRGEITPDTQVRESASRDWHKVCEVKVFVEYVKEVQVEREQQAHEAELDRAVDRVRSKRRMPYMLVALLLVGALGGGGWYGWTLWQDRGAVGPSRYTSAMFANLELPEVSARAYLDTSGPIDWSKDEVQLRKAKPEKVAKKKARKPRAGGTPRAANTGSSNDLADEAPKEHVMDLGSGSSVGREFDFADKARIRQAVVPRLETCSNNEGLRNPKFPGTTVGVRVAPSGKMSVRAGTNGRRSRAFMACARRSIRGLSVQPFDGTPVTIRVQLVTSSR